MRIYLAGRVCIETDTFVATERDFPGRQGRLLFAYLIFSRDHPVSRNDLASLLWPDELPPAWSTALNAVVSKLRSLLARCGTEWTLNSAIGYYELQLPSTVWIDIEEAARSLHEAEAVLKQGDAARAYGAVGVALHIARRPFFAGETGRWAEQEREKLRELLARALECSAAVHVGIGEPAIAVQMARELTHLEPLRERGYQLLMRAHVAAGNRAEALWTYEQCRRLLVEELGVDPSAATKAVHLEILQSP